MSHATRTAIPLIDRFLAKVQKTETCWQWMADKTGRGYGRIHDGGGHYGKTLGAHRVAYELFVGPIPEGTSVLHRCDNPGCVNPKHLFLGRQADNIADSVLKGRHRCGERSRGAKLVWRQVQEIRDQYQWGSREFGSVALGQRYGVSSTAILKIVHDLLWRSQK